ncbi:MAG: CZB domain-containing protein [Thiobacillaceae bacterium]
MDLSEAMKAHAEWKIRFRNAITNKNTMDVASISADNCCELGKWLHGESKLKFGGLKSYADCVARHALFHQEAGKVAETINANKFDEATAMLGPNTPFFIASNGVIVAIGALKKETGI